MLHEAFFNPYKLVAEGGIDPIIRGLIFTPTKDRRVELSRQFSPNLIERLFQASGWGGSLHRSFSHLIVRRGGP